MGDLLKALQHARKSISFEKSFVSSPPLLSDDLSNIRKIHPKGAVHVLDSFSNIVMIRDASGKRVGKDTSEIHSMITGKVYVKIYYQCAPDPEEALRVYVYGSQLVGYGQTRERLELDNGLVLNGSLRGGGYDRERKEIRACRFVDIEEYAIHLDGKNNAILETNEGLSCDRIVFPLAASYPLGRGSCTIPGYAVKEGKPFSIVRSDDKSTERGRWTFGGVLILDIGELEVTLVPTNRFWSSHFNRKLDHEVVAGMRHKTGRVMRQDEINEVLHKLEVFLGWIGSCMSPIVHVRGYRQGRLVYRWYRTKPHATIPRSSKWLPLFGSEDGTGDRNEVDVRGLFDKLSAMMDRDDDGINVFSTAAQFLRSNDKGMEEERPRITYLNNLFQAVMLFLSNIPDRNNGSTLQTVQNGLRWLGLEDRIHLPREAIQDLQKNHEWLWERRKQIVDNEALKNALISYPITNMRNKLTHIDELKNRRKFLSLPPWFQQYMIDVLMHLSDLAGLRYIGYDGAYMNVLTRSVDSTRFPKCGKRPFM